MLQSKMRWVRAHPILFAALLGAIVGIAFTAANEIQGLRDKNASAVLPMLVPSSIFGPGISQARVMQTGLILLIEVCANLVVYSFLFAVPVAIVVTIRRAFRSRKKPPSAAIS
jgi:hypothetical protein